MERASLAPFAATASTAQATHLSLGNDAPDPDRSSRLAEAIVAFPEAGGLDHRYERATPEDDSVEPTSIILGRTCLRVPRRRPCSIELRAWAPFTRLARLIHAETTPWPPGEPQGADQRSNCGSTGTIQEQLCNPGRNPEASLCHPCVV